MIRNEGWTRNVVSEHSIKQQQYIYIYLSLPLLFLCVILPLLKRCRLDGFSVCYSNRTLCRASELEVVAVVTSHEYRHGEHGNDEDEYQHRHDQKGVRGGYGRECCILSGTFIGPKRRIHTRLIQRSTSQKRWRTAPRPRDALFKIDIAGHGGGAPIRWHRTCGGSIAIGT